MTNQDSSKDRQGGLETSDTAQVRGNQVDTLSVEVRVKMLLAQVEIYKLKANDHDWQVYVPDSVKEKLESAIVEIDKLTQVTDHYKARKRRTSSKYIATHPERAKDKQTNDKLIMDRLYKFLYGKNKPEPPKKEWSSI